MKEILWKTLEEPERQPSLRTMIVTFYDSALSGRGKLNSVMKYGRFSDRDHQEMLIDLHTSDISLVSGKLDPGMGADLFLVLSEETCRHISSAGSWNSFLQMVESLDKPGVSLWTLVSSEAEIPLPVKEALPNRILCNRAYVKKTWISRGNGEDWFLWSAAKVIRTITGLFEREMSPTGIDRRMLGSLLTGTTGDLYLNEGEGIGRNAIDHLVGDLSGEALAGCRLRKHRKCLLRLTMGEEIFLTDLSYLDEKLDRWWPGYEDSCLYVEFLVDPSLPASYIKSVILAA